MLVNCVEQFVNGCKRDSQESSGVSFMGLWGVSWVKNGPVQKRHQLAIGSNLQTEDVMPKFDNQVVHFNILIIETAHRIQTPSSENTLCA